MDPMSLNNAIPTVTQADLHLGARPTVRSRSSSPSRAGRGGVEETGKSSSTSPIPLPSASSSKAQDGHTYPPENPNGHTTNVELPNPCKF
ncbi:hypothetical protein FA13DRAFT_527096 [Coprinellus micaceus]|uniref:Uncharacterized protein n=1 Tax=Coprinellus micaceus TaxID=71717 RepID=A0A4Y7T9J0_COPMI|nr:hypothetical protein FA13DRAFT_527096 [Coprinellus micaceus]